MAITTWTGAVSTKWNDVSNWTNGIPAATDTVYIGKASRGIAPYDASAVALTSLTIFDTFEHEIGGEGKSETLKLDPTTLIVGMQQGTVAGAGSPFMNLDLYDNPANVYIRQTGKRRYPMKPALQIVGNDALHTLYVSGGDVGIATNHPEDTATIGAIYTGHTKDGNPIIVTIGRGCTLSAGGVHTAGKLWLHGTIGGTLVVRGGETVIDTPGTITQFDVEGGTVYFDRHGTISTLNALGGVLDWTRTTNPRTVTTCLPNVASGRTLVILADVGSTGRVTFTNGLVPTKSVRFSTSPL